MRFSSRRPARRLLGPRDRREEVAVGAVAALVMGWIAFEPCIRAGTGLTATPVGELATLATAIFDLARTPPGDAATPHPQ